MRGPSPLTPLPAIARITTAQTQTTTAPLLGHRGRGSKMYRTTKYHGVYRTSPLRRILPYLTKRIFSAVRNVEKPVLVLLLFVYRRHQRGGGRHLVVHKDKNRLLWRKLDPHTNHVDKLTDGEIRGYQVFFLIKIWNGRLLCLFTNDGNPLRIFRPYTLRLGLAFLCFVKKSTCGNILR